MSGSILNDVTIPLVCPKCSAKVEKTIAWLKDNKEMTCGGCGVVIALESDDLHRTLKGVDDALDKIPRTITFKI